MNESTLGMNEIDYNTAEVGAEKNSTLVFLAVPSATILKIRAEHEIGEEDSFEYKISALTARIKILENKLEITLQRFDYSNNTEVFDDSEVYRAEILAAKRERDTVITVEREVYIAKKKTELLSAAGRKGAFTRQINRLSKKMAACVDAGDSVSEEFVSIRDRFKKLSENYFSSVDKFDRNKKTYEKAKVISDEEVIFQKAITNAFENNLEDENFTAIISEEANTSKKEEELQEIKTDHKNTDLALKEIQFGGRISFFDKLRLRIKNKIDEKPKLQKVVSKMKTAAVVLSVMGVAGTLFGEYLLHDGAVKINTMPASTPSIRSFAPRRAENPGYTVGDKKTAANLQSPASRNSDQNIYKNIDSEELAPYKVELPKTENQTENIVADTTSIENPSIIQEKISSQELTDKISEKAAELNISPELVADMTGPNLEKTQTIYEKNKLIAFPSEDVTLKTIVDFNLETIE